MVFSSMARGSAFSRTATIALSLLPIVSCALKDPSIVKGSFIVEFDVAESASPASEFYSNLTSSNIQSSPRITLDHKLFNGVSFNLLHDDSEIDDLVAKISSMSLVQKVWPVRLYKKPVVAYDSSAIFNQPQGGSLDRRDAYVDTFAPHVMGGVDKLHAEGYTGAGLSVAIVDTGVDYNHPALGGGFGPGYKIAYGYDLVGDDYDGTNTPVPDPDPYSSCEGHGTHVAGIVGASSNPYNFTGIVPDATLGMYRVFGCYDNVGNDVLISAFNMAYEAGADVITSSIGGASGWTEDSWAVAVQRIVEAGTPCTIAAGNDGADGIFYASGAADAIGAIAVGSVDSTTLPANLSSGTWTTNSSTYATESFNYNLGTPSDIPIGEYPIWALTLNASVVDDACSAFPADTPDLSSYLVLIRRGTCTFVEKATNAAAYGAKYIFFYNNAVTGTISPSADGAPVNGTAMVTADLGAEWISLLAAGDSIEATISGDSAIITVENNITGGYMSTYTSISPTWEVYIKPEVSAPGGNILSTYPLADGGYAVLSGTSMATPYIAGVVALIKQVRGDLSPDTIRSILGTTSNPVDYNDGTDTYPYLAPVIQQGGGLVDAYSAVHTASILGVPNLSFNDTTNIKPTQSFTITNTGNSSISYSFSELDALTAYTLPSGDLYPSLFPVDLDTTAATIKISPANVTVGPGSSTNITISLTLPVGLDESRIPVYSGFVSILASDGTNYTLPYAGVDSALINATVFDIEDGYPYLSSSADATAAAVAAGTNFTISLSNSTGNSTDIPDIYIALALGSAYIDVDLIPVVESNVTWTNSSAVGLGSIAGFPQLYYPRASEWATTFNGTLADGTLVPAGKYTLLTRALKILGDPNVEADYEVVETVPFSIAYSP